MRKSLGTAVLNNNPLRFMGWGAIFHDPSGKYKDSTQWRDIRRVIKIGSILRYNISSKQTVREVYNPNKA